MEMFFLTTSPSLHTMSYNGTFFFFFIKTYPLAVKQAVKHFVSLNAATLQDAPSPLQIRKPESEPLTNKKKAAESQDVKTTIELSFLFFSFFF